VVIGLWLFTGQKWKCHYRAGGYKSMNQLVTRLDTATIFLEQAEIAATIISEVIPPSPESQLWVN
jgi:hypothetical protein